MGPYWPLVLLLALQISAAEFKLGQFVVGVSDTQIRVNRDQQEIWSTSNGPFLKLASTQWEFNEVSGHFFIYNTPSTQTVDHLKDLGDSVELSGRLLGEGNLSCQYTFTLGLNTTFSENQLTFRATITSCMFTD